MRKRGRKLSKAQNTPKIGNTCTHLCQRLDAYVVVVYAVTIHLLPPTSTTVSVGVERRN